MAVTQATNTVVAEIIKTQIELQLPKLTIFYKTKLLKINQRKQAWNNLKTTDPNDTRLLVKLPTLWTADKSIPTEESDQLQSLIQSTIAQRLVDIKERQYN